MSAHATLHPGVAVATASPNARHASLPAMLIAKRVGYVLFALFMFFTCFTFLRPSPYDFAALPTLVIWTLLGLRLHRGAVPYIVLLLLLHIGIVVSLIPYMDEPAPMLWSLQSFYLMVTGFFFVMFFSEETKKRITLGVDAYVASCLFAAICGIISYFAPSGPLFTIDGGARAAGVFEDPNLLGTFLIFGIVVTIRRLLAGETRYPVLSGLALLVMLTAELVAFSRGAWGATAMATLMTIAFTYRSSPQRVRRRVTILVAAGGLLVVGSLSALLLDENIASTLQDRFTVTKDYDEGVTGRFGNQVRSIPMLIERPNGFGPLRFRLRFGLEPHNSYIGAFANGGWLGGFSFLALAILTTFVTLRLCIVDSPYRNLAQSVGPPTLMIFMQAFQIDIDHWRHVYIMFGMVWALECARLRWLARVSNRHYQRPKSRQFSQ